MACINFTIFTFFFFFLITTNLGIFFALIWKILQQFLVINLRKLLFSASDWQISYIFTSDQLASSAIFSFYCLTNFIVFSQMIGKNPTATDRSISHFIHGKSVNFVMFSFCQLENFVTRNRVSKSFIFFMTDWRISDFFLFFPWRSIDKFCFFKKVVIDIKISWCFSYTNRQIFVAFSWDRLERIVSFFPLLMNESVFSDNLLTIFAIF